MTDVGAGGDAARAARIAQLRQRRGAAEPGPATATARPSRAGVGSGSKVAAAGLGLASMLGLVAAMSIAARPSAPSSPVAAQPPASPQQVVVVVPRVDGATTPATNTPSQPIELRVQPTVRQAPPSRAPSGRTNGSR